MKDMERAIIIDVTGLDWEFVERLTELSSFAGLSRLKYRASLLPPYPPDPVLASAMCATGLGCGEHGIFQSASLNSSEACFIKSSSSAKKEFMKHHISRFLSQRGIYCLWHRGLYTEDCIASNEVAVRSLGVRAPINSELPVIDPLVEPPTLFELENINGGCEIKGLCRIDGLRAEQVDKGKRLKVFYLGKNVLLERGRMTAKFSVALRDKHFRFRILFPVDGSQPRFIACDHDPSTANLKLSNPEELAWVIEEEMGGAFNFGRWAEFEAAKLGLLDIDSFITELYEHLNRSLRFLLSSIEAERYQFIYFWEESFELARRLFSSVSDFNHQRFDPEMASSVEKKLINMLFALDSAVERILKMAEGKKWLIILMSNYGLAPYRIGFDLNRWLVSENFASGEVDANNNWTFDWKNTRAFSIGPLIYVNLYGRTANGTVMPGLEEENLVREITNKLRALECPMTYERVVKTVRRFRKIYSGRYLFDGPELVVGLFPSYRIFSGLEVFSINSSFDGASSLGLAPEVIKGFAMSNLSILPEASAVDIFPTVVKFFRLELKRRVEGKCLLTT